MGRSIRAATIGAALILIASISPISRGASAADFQSVTSWIDLSATSPAVGCDISVSVEVRNGGYAVSSTEVMIALFAGDTLISSDRSVTNGSGVAFLGVSTGGSSGSGWMDIDVAGSYLRGLPISLGGGDSCDSGAKMITAEGEVPVATVDSGPDDVEGVFVSGVPFYQQQRNLSCEYASLHIATAAYGDPVSEYSFDDVVGWSDNPHWGYRGDISGWWGNTTDYGVYAEPLAAALTSFGFYGDVFYSGGDTSLLTHYIDADVPVLVWIGMWGDDSIIDETDGVTYQVTAGMHVVVAYGYNDGGIWVSDPASGGPKYWSWGDFIYMWSVMDGMSLAVLR